MTREKIATSDLPAVRGKYVENAELSALTWFRVGGPADVLFMPADEDDLADFLKNLDENIPVYPVGVGSNLLVRDGGVRGVVIRLGSSFRRIEVDGLRVTAGAAAIDAQVAKHAAKAGVAGLEFFRGVPGTIGGALAMNAGAYDGETKDVLVEAVAYDRRGRRHVLSNGDMKFSYRHCGAADGLIFTQASFQGRAGDPAAILARMEEISARREATQPIRERTGGSTFANPDPELFGGRKAWQLIDEIGGRGRVVGDAQVSERHCNFMINRGRATAADLEELIESLRKDVLTKTGVALRWEIRRIGGKVAGCRLQVAGCRGGYVSEVQSFRDLKVWRRAMDLVQSIYALVEDFPKQEEYRLTSQIIRAAVSVPANIAEGQRRGTRKDYAHFLNIARGSVAEVETLLLVAERVNFATGEQIGPLVDLSDEISRMLFAMNRKLTDSR